MLWNRSSDCGCGPPVTSSSMVMTMMMMNGECSGRRRSNERKGDVVVSHVCTGPCVLRCVALRCPALRLMRGAASCVALGSVA